MTEAERITRQCQRLGVHLSAEGGRIVVDGPLTPELYRAVADHQEAILDALKRKRGGIGRRPGRGSL